MEWINIDKKLPSVNQIVDLWDGHQRHCNYKLVKNYGGTRGNNFFDPVFGGVACIRYGGEPHYTNATHWIVVTPPRKERKKR